MSMWLVSESGPLNYAQLTTLLQVLALRCRQDLGFLSLVVAPSPNAGELEREVVSRKRQSEFLLVRCVFIP